MDQHGAKIFKEKEKACEHAQFQIRKHYLLSHVYMYRKHNTSCCTYLGMMYMCVCMLQYMYVCVKG